MNSSNALNNNSHNLANVSNTTNNALAVSPPFEAGTGTVNPSVLLFMPSIETITPVQLANPYSTLQTRDQALTLIQQRNVIDPDSSALLVSLSQSVGSLQAILDDKDQDIERLKKEVFLLNARIEIQKKISDFHKREVASSHQKTAMHQRQVIDMQKELVTLRGDLRKANDQKKEAQQMVSGLLRKVSSIAADAWKGKQGDPTQVFPDIRDSLCALRFEVLATSGQLNVVAGVPADSTVHSAVTRTLRLVDDTIKLLNEVEQAAKSITGNIHNDSSWDKRIRKAARGVRVNSIRDILPRFR
ncbi:hypothetical protein V5O48_014027 [Marasmius crinis-equi]|uniref:Uncharacterized protein n=1 Tax=Marasmius crinis-equi TaxID=585013 RepID=A0ABR3EYF6_9AGAR